MRGNSCAHRPTAIAIATGRAVSTDEGGGGPSEARPGSETGARAWPRYGTDSVPEGAKPQWKRCTSAGWLAATRTMRDGGHAAPSHVPAAVASQPHSVRQKLGKLPWKMRKQRAYDGL